MCPLIAQSADSLDPELYIRNDLFEYIPEVNLFFCFGSVQLSYIKQDPGLAAKMNK